MSSESPDVVLYDVSGNALAVQNATSILTNTPALMIAGSDGTNSRYITLDTSGRPLVVGYGAVTTSAPAYSTGTSQALSISTTGGLRVTGLGTAGTADPNVVTVQGITGGTTLPVTAVQGTANSLANAWPIEITDGTHGPVAVKAASTSAAAADSALVVSQTPNLPTTVTVTKITVNASTNGNNTLVAGVASETVRVFKVALVFSAGGTVIFQDGASTALTGPLVLSAGATIVLDMDITNPWFLTSSGNAFVINLSGGAAVGGVIYYTQS